LRLADIVDNIDAIQEYLGSSGYAEFAADRRTVDATERCLERISEAVVKIGTDRMAEIDPDLPVERVRGLGNVIRHAYDTIDLRLIYNLVIINLPPLRAACIAALGG
jgi:uncharacterized protein with HEPN domain